MKEPKIDTIYFRELRHRLHTIPELAFEEKKTGDLIAKELDLYGIPCERGWAKTGIVAWIKKGDSKRSVALRADMDALPITEENGLSYRSIHPGKMHACGHDGHMTMLLAAAKSLKEEIDFDGTVYLIFQPAEEGEGGAKVMIEEGLFTKYPIDRIYGLHNRPSEPSGTFLIKKGAVMSSVDTWQIEIEGKSAHSSQPHIGLNPIVIASHIVLAIKGISSLDIAPDQSHVITVAKIESGTAFNIIPDRCIIEGSVRAYSEAVQNLIESRIRTIPEGIAKSFGARAHVTYTRMYPPTINSYIDTALAAAQKTVSPERIVTEFPSSFGSEDFSFFLQKKEGCYIWLGAKEDADTAPLHSSRYDFNDNLIETGAHFWINLVQEELPKTISKELS